MALVDWARVLPESRSRSVLAARADKDGRSALRVELLDELTRNGTPEVDYVDMPTFVELPIELVDGVIEVAILARLNGCTGPRPPSTSESGPICDSRSSGTPSGRW